MIWQNGQHLNMLPHGFAYRRATKFQVVRFWQANTRRTNNRASTLLRIAAVNVGKTQTALGPFYRRLAARIGKAKAVTATARKLAVLFYNLMRYGESFVDPGADYYEQQYRKRVFENLSRRAKNLGFELKQIMEVTATTSAHVS